MVLISQGRRRRGGGQDYNAKIGEYFDIIAQQGVVAGEEICLYYKYTSITYLVVVIVICVRIIYTSNSFTHPVCIYYIYLIISNMVITILVLNLTNNRDYISNSVTSASRRVIECKSTIAGYIFV